MCEDNDFDTHRYCKSYNSRTLRFRCAFGFATQILAYMLDSLVRVSRRVVQGQTWKSVHITAVPKETMQPKSHALTLVLFSNLHQLPLKVHHTAISHRRLPSVHFALSRDRFPFNNFTCYLTPFSRCFSSFPHGTCSLSVAEEYLGLESGLPMFRQDCTCPALLKSSSFQHPYGTITL